MSCDAADILAELATTVAAMVTSRDNASHFLQHQSNEPFEHTPIAGNDGFDVRMPGFETGPAFGSSTQYQSIGHFEIVLGHAPFDTDVNRAKFAARDAQRIADVIERHQWAASPVDFSFLEGIETNRDNADWWLTIIKFRIAFWGAKES